jgi:hypothetical protein
MPLELPDASEQLAQPMTQLTRALGDKQSEVAAMLIEAASSGNEQVEMALKEFLEEVLPVEGGRQL